MSNVFSSNEHGLCSSCANFRLLTFKGKNKYRKSCREVEIEDTPPIESCKFYFNNQWIRLESLQEISWKFDSHKKGSIGFFPPEKSNDKNLIDPLAFY